MRRLISCDMEGLSGMMDWEQVTPAKDEWKRGCKLMAGEVKAAINGAFEAGGIEPQSIKRTAIFGVTR